MLAPTVRARPDPVFLDIRLDRSSGLNLLPDVESETAMVFVDLLG
jgi:DNA-binding NtrC family response regulator